MGALTLWAKGLCVQTRSRFGVLKRSGVSLTGKLAEYDRVLRVPTVPIGLAREASVTTNGISSMPVIFVTGADCTRSHLALQSDQDPKQP